MTISPFLARLGLCGGLVLAAAAGVWCLVLYVRGRPWSRRLSAASLAVGGLATAFAIYTRWLDLVIVRNGENGPHAERYVRLGELGNVPYAQGATRDRDEGVRDPTCVLNESTTPVQIENVAYGGTFGVTGEPIVVPPHTAACVRSVDYLGRDDTPPSIVLEDERTPNMAFRTWVTWD